jgi:hypothetical protein
VRFIGLAFATIALRCVALPAQAYTPAEAQAFDRGDRESRDLLNVVNCLNWLRTAVQSNRVAQYEDWTAARECVVLGQHYVWIAIGGDTTFDHPTRISAYDLTTGAPYAERLDTAGIAAIARAERDALARHGQEFNAQHPGVPLTFTFDGDSIEVWMMPRPLLTGKPWTLGGERGEVYTPDGRHLAREIDNVADTRLATVPDTGAVSIQSRQARIPSLSEFLLANELNAMGRDISINVRGLSSLLSGKSGAPWAHFVVR